MKALLGSLDVWDLVESGFQEPDAAEEAIMENEEKVELRELRKKGEEGVIHNLSRN